MGAIRNLANLSSIINLNQPSTFLETGAGYGTGIFTVLPFYNFREIISVEIDADQTNLLNRFFRFDTRVRVFNATSQEFLAQVLPQLDNRPSIFFFLDAHFPQADFGLKAFDEEKDENIRMPLWQECLLIKENRVKAGHKDTILIDDISLYDESDRVYQDDVKKRHNASVLLPKNHKGYLTKIIELFSETHNAEIIPSEQGYLLLTPKY